MGGFVGNGKKIAASRVVFDEKRMMQGARR